MKKAIAIAVCVGFAVCGYWTGSPKLFAGYCFLAVANAIHPALTIPTRPVV